MTYLQAIALVVIRVFAIEQLIRGIGLASVSIATLFDSQHTAFFSGTFLWGSQIAFGILIWFLARSLARFVSPRAKVPQQEFSVTPRDLVNVGTFLIGIHILLVQLPQPAAMTVLAVVRSLAGYSLALKDWAYVVQFVPTVLVSVFLIFRYRTIGNLFSRGDPAPRD